MHVYVCVGESASERQRPREKKRGDAIRNNRSTLDTNRRNHKRLMRKGKCI